MALDAVSNFGKVTVSGSYDASQYQVTVSDATRFPDPGVAGEYNLVWYNDTDYPDPADDPNREIVRAVSVSGNIVTLQHSGSNRVGQEGTTPSTKNTAGKVYKMILAITKKMIDDIKDTDNLVEGSTNLFYTETHFNTSLAAKTTDDLNEGVVNQYFTNSRADARITAQKGLANGLATLDSGGKIPSSQLPAIAITDTFVVVSQAAMLALTAEVGDVAVRTDLNKTFILRVAGASTLANWQEMLTPTDTVLSVNGQTGAVTLTTTNINEGTNLYYTTVRARGAVSATSPLSYDSSTGIFTTSMATGKLIGRSTAGTGVMEQITLGASLALAGGTLSTVAPGATGDIQINTGGAFDVDTGNFLWDKTNHVLYSRSGLGTEKLNNGAFATGGTWTLGTGWSISAGAAHHNSNGTGALLQNLGAMVSAITIGVPYVLTYTVLNLTVGSVTPSIGGVTLTTRSANGTYTEYVTPTALTQLAFTATNTARLDIDDVSLKPLIGGSIYTGGDFVGRTGYFARNGGGASSADGLVLLNETLATNSVVQSSPSLVLQGQAWLTNSTISQSIAFKQNVLPGSSTTVKGTWRLQMSQNAAAYTNLLTVDELGQMVLTPQSGALAGYEINMAASNGTPGTTQHIKLSNSGAYTYITGYFSGVLKNSILFDSGGSISMYSSNGGYNWYSGTTSPTYIAYMAASEFHHYSYITATNGMYAGSSGTPPSTLTTNGSFGKKPVLITSSTNLDGSYSDVFIDATNASVCAGNPTYGCGHWTNQSDCVNLSNHGGGCGWTTYTCSDYNGDESACSSHGCTPSYNPCSDFNGNSTSCTNQSGCSYPGNAGNCHSFDSDPGSCGSYGCSFTAEVDGNCSDFNGNTAACNSVSGCFTSSGSTCGSYGNSTDCTNSGCTSNSSNCTDFNSDENGCNTTSGCTASYGGNCNDFNDGGGDGSVCNSHGGCSYDPDSGVCSGNYFSSCSGAYFSGCSGDNSVCGGTYLISASHCDGSYDDGTCSGSYFTGGCTGTSGVCSGTPLCSGISVGSCTSEPGCVVEVGIVITYPTDGANFSRSYWFKNVGTAGKITFQASMGSGHTLERTDLSTPGDQFQSSYFQRTANCAGLDEGGCVGLSPYCTAFYTDCSAGSDSGGDGTACAALSGCSYDGGSGVCSGSPYNSCGGIYTVYKKWMSMSDGKTGSLNTLAYLSTISLDPLLSSLHQTTTIHATGNATIDATSAGNAEQVLTVIINNDGTSGKTITFGTHFHSSGTLTGTTSKTATVTFRSDGSVWIEIGRQTGI